MILFSMPILQENYIILYYIILYSVVLNQSEKTVAARKRSADSCPSKAKEWMHCVLYMRSHDMLYDMIYYGLWYMI
jgi:hypothetical protein